MSRLELMLIFGGCSPEHEVSLVSAQGIHAQLDPERFAVVLVGVTRAGEPRLGGPELFADGLSAGAGRPIRWPTHAGDRTLRDAETGAVLTRPIDVALPIIHGSGGEDGTIQGVMSLAGIPCVGAGVLGSALALDKDRSRRMLAQAGIPVIDDVVLEGPEALRTEQVLARIAPLGWPVFVKPARAGSSVGISKVSAPRELEAALQGAYAVDHKLLVERALPEPRELETAVLGNLDPQASVVGEIEPHGTFYDYHAKYVSAQSRLLIPAPIEPELSDRIRALALRAFRALDLSGLARVDFLLSRSTGELVLNEPNTLPGFTPISMYPKLWEASGVPYPELLRRLVALAIERGPRGGLVG